VFPAMRPSELQRTCGRQTTFYTAAASNNLRDELEVGPHDVPHIQERETKHSKIAIMGRRARITRNHTMQRFNDRTRCAEPQPAVAVSSTSETERKHLMTTDADVELATVDEKWIDTAINIVTANSDHVPEVATSETTAHKETLDAAENGSLVSGVGAAIQNGWASGSERLDNQRTMAGSVPAKPETSSDYTMSGALPSDLANGLGSLLPEGQSDSNLFIWDNWIVQDSDGEDDDVAGRPTTIYDLPPKLFSRWRHLLTGGSPVSMAQGTPQTCLKAATGDFVELRHDHLLQRCSWELSGRCEAADRLKEDRGCLEERISIKLPAPMPSGER